MQTMHSCLFPPAHVGLAWEECTAGACHQVATVIRRLVEVPVSFTAENHLFATVATAALQTLSVGSRWWSIPTEVQTQRDELEDNPCWEAAAVTAAAGSCDQGGHGAPCWVHSSQTLHHFLIVEKILWKCEWTFAWVLHLKERSTQSKFDFSLSRLWFVGILDFFIHPLKLLVTKLQLWTVSDTHIAPVHPAVGLPGVVSMGSLSQTFWTLTG